VTPVPSRPVRSPGPAASTPARTAKSDDDGEIAEVLRARKGDEAAFAALVRRRQGLVAALLAARVRGRSDVEDLAQEVFLRAWRRLPELREPERFTGWLARIAVNAALDHRRRVAVRPRPASLDGDGAAEPAADLPPADHAILLREEFARVLEALGTLDGKSQAAVVLRYREGLAVKEVAARLGDSPAAVAMRLTRALRAIRARLP